MTGSIKGHFRKLNLCASNALNGDLHLLFVGIMPSVMMCLSGCLSCVYQHVYMFSIILLSIVILLVDSTLLSVSYHTAIHCEFTC